MAQDKKAEAKADAGSDAPFVPPDFDEDAFIHRELVSFRTTGILFAWGIVAALASWAVFATMDGAYKSRWLVGIVICAASFGALPLLFRKLGADTKHFGRREWLGTGFLFFFSFLAFFLLFVNPPLSDFAGPDVDLHANPPIQAEGGDVTVEFFAEDNVGVEEAAIALSRDGAPVPANVTDLGHGRHQVNLTGLAPGTYRADATASDAKGQDTAGHLEFTVRGDILSYSASAGGRLTGAADRVVVTTGDLPTCKARRGVVTTTTPCVRTVRLEMEAGGNVILGWDKEDKQWVATTEDAGWTMGNNTFDVVAVLADQYQGNTRFDGGSVREGPHTVDVSGDLGSDVATVYEDHGPPQRNVPGLGLPLLAVGLVAAVAAMRRRA